MYEHFRKFKPKKLLSVKSIRKLCCPKNVKLQELQSSSMVEKKLALLYDRWGIAAPPGVSTATWRELFSVLCSSWNLCCSLPTSETMCCCCWCCVPFAYNTAPLTGSGPLLGICAMMWGAGLVRVKLGVVWQGSMVWGSVEGPGVSRGALGGEEAWY